MSEGAVGASSSRGSDGENDAAAANGREARREDRGGGRAGEKRRRASGSDADVKVVTVGRTPHAKGASGGVKSTVAGETPRQRPTNNQLLYRVNFNWEHYEHALPAMVRRMLPKTTEACPSVTSAFLQTLRALDMAESQRVKNPRNILQLLSVNTRRTKVVALNAGTHRVPEELRRHQLSDQDGNEYSTNLDRNRYGNDNNYLYTVTRFNLQALELCPLVAEVQIIGTKGSEDDVLLCADKSECGCGGNRKVLSNHWTVPAFVLPSQMPTTIPKSTLAAKDRSRKKSRSSMSSGDFRRDSETPERDDDDADRHAGMGVLLDALTSVGGIPASPAPPSRVRPAPVMSPSRPIRGIRQVELDLGAINQDTAAAREQIAQATAHSIDQIPDDQLREELRKAIARSCELHMTASAAQMRQHKAEREAEEYKVIVSRLEELLAKSETVTQRMRLQNAKADDETMSGSSNENDRVIQCSAFLAHKLIAMQQSLAALAARFELLADQTAPRSVVEELLRAEMAAHLQTNQALLRAETSLAAYAAAEATCDEEIWRTQYVKAAQLNLEKAAYMAQMGSAPTPFTKTSDVAAAPPPAPAFTHSEPSVKFIEATPVAPATAPQTVKSIALMADAVAVASVEASHLPPKTPLGLVKPMRHAFISPP